MQSHSFRQRTSKKKYEKYAMEKKRVTKMNGSTTGHPPASVSKKKFVVKNQKINFTGP